MSDPADLWDRYTEAQDYYDEQAFRRWCGEAWSEAVVGGRREREFTVSEVPMVAAGGAGEHYWICDEDLWGPVHERACRHEKAPGGGIPLGWISR